MHSFQFTKGQFRKTKVRQTIPRLCLMNLISGPISNTFVRQYQQSSAEKRSGGTCDTLLNHGQSAMTANVKYRGRSSGQSTLCLILLTVQTPWGKRTVAKDLKVRVCWVIAYLENVKPNTSDPNWRRFQCSHRCLNDYCTTLVLNGSANAHVCWESPSNNQNRGHNRSLCFKPCSHCQRPLCHCQEIHTPACL